jgi:hypothetical protein
MHSVPACEEDCEYYTPRGEAPVCRATQKLLYRQANINGSDGNESQRGASECGLANRRTGRLNQPRLIRNQRIATVQRARRRRARIERTLCSYSENVIVRRNRPVRKADKLRNAIRYFKISLNRGPFANTIRTRAIVTWCVRWIFGFPRISGIVTARADGRCAIHIRRRTCLTGKTT